jgi:hypothetical protein
MREDPVRLGAVGERRVPFRGPVRLGAGQGVGVGEAPIRLGAGGGEESLLSSKYVHAQHEPVDNPPCFL